MKKYIFNCATCNKELKGNDEVYSPNYDEDKYAVYSPNYGEDNDNYYYKPFCSFDCMLDDLSWDTEHIDNLYGKKYTTKCATCGQELKSHDLIYFSLNEDKGKDNNYCSYKCMLKNIPWSKETVNSIYERTNYKITIYEED